MKGEPEDWKATLAFWVGIALTIIAFGGCVHLIGS